MNARRCQGCAAPLPEGNSPEALRCRFCGLAHDPVRPFGGQPAVHQVHISAGAARGPLRWILAIVVLITVASLIPAALGLYAGWRAVSTVAENVELPRTPPHVPPLVEKPRTTTTTRRTPARLVPADLRTAGPGVHALDAAPPAGGYAAIDAVAALPWALTIAQAWAADARLERIDVTRMRPDGTINVQDDGEAGLRYRFKSPARIAALTEQARLTSSARAATSLFMTVERGQPRAQVIESSASSERGRTLPPHPSVLPLPRLVAVDDVERLLSDVPFVSGYLIYIDDEGWAWYFSTLAGEGKPRVRARDGAVWPYRRGR